MRQSVRVCCARQAAPGPLCWAIGVDRVDYTKGLPERLLGVERFFEKYPVYRGQFTFVQIGAPSRTHIRRYQDLMDEVQAEVERINKRFQTDAGSPSFFWRSITATARFCRTTAPPTCVW